MGLLPNSHCKTITCLIFTHRFTNSALRTAASETSRRFWPLKHRVAFHDCIREEKSTQKSVHSQAGVFAAPLSHGLGGNLPSLTHSTSAWPRHHHCFRLF